MLRFILFALAAYLIYRLIRGAKPQLRGAEPGAGELERQPHEVLGVEPDADDATIRRAYQKMIGEYHPDKIAGMAPELRHLAERRTMEINAAYERLRRD
jgi:DnaJ-domain-containing protein 1